MWNEREILKNLNILYAEDDETMRLNTSKTLKLFCNKVYQVNNGSEALELFQNEPIHIVILDYVMPIMDGYSVAKKIRETDKDIPIFITSSYTEKEKLLSVIGLNVIGYLEKPIDFKELMKMLEQCVTLIEENGKLTSNLGYKVEYDFLSKNVTVKDKIVELTKHEYQFLEMLLKHKRSVLSTHQIEDMIFFGEVDPNTLRNMIYRLRKKIGKDIIVTIKDIGYSLNIQ